jgi:hypothetical protein
VFPMIIPFENSNMAFQITAGISLSTLVFILDFKNNLCSEGQG